jgi:hypothetical protein
MPIEIPDEAASEAITTLRELNKKETPDNKTDLRRERAATSLLKLYQTQQRYSLTPQSPADFARATRRPNSAAQQLERMTPSRLDELQAEMTADYPGRRL